MVRNSFFSLTTNNVLSFAVFSRNYLILNRLNVNRIYIRVEFTKDNIDIYLKEVAKEYRKQVGKGMPAELVLIGGASVLINYGFRNMTTDIDALIRAASSMKDAINRVGDRYGLPIGWLNADFKSTDSYTPKLDEFSVYYRNKTSR